MSKENYSAIVSSPLGNIGFKLEENKLIRLEFVSAKFTLIKPVTPLARQVVDQITHYFRDAKYRFNLPLLLSGTTHQQRIWQALAKIPTGVITSYGALAEQLNTSARVIGNACRANPIPIIIPCHRIVAKNGLGGYNGARNGQWLAIKTWLLQHESIKSV